MIRILTGVKVRHAACGAILRQITASKGSKGSKGSTLVFTPFSHTVQTVQTGDTPSEIGNTHLLVFTPS